MNLQIVIDANDLFKAADLVAENALALAKNLRQGRKRDQAEGELRIAVADYRRQQKNMMVRL